EQGRIGQIVSARPEDRRLFIEEAAGVTKYKQRRKQAERKMDMTRQNLARVHDIVSEIERTSAALQRQVAKAERYKSYRYEHEDLVLHDASHHLLELIVVETVQTTTLESGKTELAELAEGLLEAETGLTQARAAVAEIESRTDDASKRAFAADNDVSALQAENQRAKDRIAHLEERLKSATEGQAEATTKIAELESEGNEMSARLVSLTDDEGARESDAEGEDQALEELREQEAAAVDELESIRKDLADARAQAASAEARLDGLATRRLDGQERLDALKGEKDAIVGERETLHGRKSALATALAEAESGKKLTEEERAQLETEIASL